MNTPFEFLENCFLKTEKVTSEENQFAEYYPVIHMLSFYPSVRSYMHRMSILQSQIPSWALGCVLYHLCPKSHRLPRSPKYISAKATASENAPALEVIQKIFCVRPKHAKQIEKLLAQQKISLGEKAKRRK